MPNTNHLSPRLTDLVAKGVVLHQSLASRLDDLLIQKTRKKIFSVACFDLTIEHHLAICQLVSTGAYGSAFALARPAFEGFVRGVWLLNFATDQEISSYQQDKKPPEINKVISQIEQGGGFESGRLNDIKKACWSAMCSYTHGGVMQASRRHTEDTIEPDYKEEEILELLRLAGTCALLAFQQIAGVAGALEVAMQANDLLVAHIKDHKQ